MSGSKTTFLGRRIGYNEEKRKRARAQKFRRIADGAVRWFKRRGWIVCLVLIVIGIAAWNNRFYLQRFNPMELRHLQYIDIEGNRMLSWEDVVQNAQVEPGMLMSEVQSDSVEKALMQLPLIHSAQVEKHFPSSLTIKLQEASPVIAFYVDGKAQVYSERGLLMPMSTSTALHLPVATTEDVEKVRSMAKFLNEMRLKDKHLYENVSQIAWSEEDGAYEVFFRDVGHKVLFAEGKTTEQTFVLYNSVKFGFPQDLRCALEVDMRFNGFAYIRNFDKRCVNG